ncbi:MAG: SLAP domain-containing protein, partial [Lactobacillus crispatus]
APVAASAVSVNAADSTATTTANATDYTNINLGGTTVSNTENQVDVTPSIVLNGNVKNTAGNLISKATLSGSISATFGGKSYTANLRGTDQNNVLINGRTAKDELSNVNAGSSNTITIKNVGFNFGPENKGKTITLVSSNSKVTFGSDNAKTVTVSLDQNGTAKDLTVNISDVTAFNATNTNGVVFYNVTTGTQAHAGNAMVLANTQGQLNTAALLPAIESNYVAVQRVDSDSANGNGTYNFADFKHVNNIEFATAIKDQLKAQNIDVGPQGFFKAPHTFTVKVKATSSINGKSEELPVTFTVANVAEEVAPSVSKTIMHNAYYYDKDAKRVGTDKLTRYNSVTVSPKTTTISGKAYYEVVENGKLSGKFINADNIDGTKRTLKHNAYVYATSKKRANKVVLKKGEEVTTYGGTYTFKNGKQYYKIGNDTKKTYVKASNF